jgi:hypothetical protein
VEDTQAAHIYDVWRIKVEIKDMINKDPNVSQGILDSIINKASDPSNGILLLNAWHYYFDKGLFTFNINGEIIIKSEQSDRLKPILFFIDNTNNQNHEIKIKEKVLNNKMRHYLLNRT